MAPPPPPPPAPPPIPTMSKSGGRGSQSKAVPMDRNAMLSQIRQGTRLKKAPLVNDRSAPIIGNEGKGNSGSSPNAKIGSSSMSTSNSSRIGSSSMSTSNSSRIGSSSMSTSNSSGSSSSSGPMNLGGLFAGGMPKLRSTGKKLVPRGDTDTADSSPSGGVSSSVYVTNRIVNGNGNTTTTSRGFQSPGGAQSNSSIVKPSISGGNHSSIKASLEQQFSAGLNVSNNVPNNVSNNVSSLMSSKCKSSPEKSTGKNNSSSIPDTIGQKFHTLNLTKNRNHNLDSSSIKGPGPISPPGPGNQITKSTVHRSNTSLAKRPAKPPPMKPPPPPKIGLNNNTIGTNTLGSSGTRTLVAVNRRQSFDGGKSPIVGNQNQIGNNRSPGDSPPPLPSVPPPLISPVSPSSESTLPVIPNEHRSNAHMGGGNLKPPPPPRNMSIPNCLLPGLTATTVTTSSGSTKVTITSTGKPTMSVNPIQHTKSHSLSASGATSATSPRPFGPPPPPPPNHRSITSPSVAPPPPPSRTGGSPGGHSSVGSHSMVGRSMAPAPPAPPPPPPSQTGMMLPGLRSGTSSLPMGQSHQPLLRNTSISKIDLEARFGPQFKEILTLPSPVQFGTLRTSGKKIYPSQSQQEKRRRDPPPPPPSGGNNYNEHAQSNSHRRPSYHGSTSNGPSSQSAAPMFHIQLFPGNNNVAC